jgi:hypothetical protein
MNNNTQIETVETLDQFINRQPYYGTCTTEYKEGIEIGANWRKQQDEAKYKELLDSHNELLGRLELINPILLKYADAINGDCCLPNTAFEMITKSGHIKLDVQINEELINKAKNIKT